MASTEPDHYARAVPKAPSRGSRWSLGLLLLALSACAPSSPSATPPEASAKVSATPSVGSVSTASSSAASDAGSAGDAATEAASAAGPAPITASRARSLMFLGDPPPEAQPCGEQPDEAAQIRCLLAVHYRADKQAAKAAIALYDEAGTVCGIEAPRMMDGGWRGMLKLVPHPPVGHNRRHLQWLLAAAADFNQWFVALHEDQTARARYRWQPLELRFFRSVGRTTPSAYADGWTISYNVSGSLHSSDNAVRETMFHEIFHLNDRDHGNWSERHLTPIYDSIVARCTNKWRKLNTACLRPFAPHHVMVRGGTYYAFQPGNGVWEYAAELATRYYFEHREILAGRSLAKPPFKCGPQENGQSWKLLVDEFFGGIDRVPPCP
ncbi:MAG: hypothetical protein JRI68_00900 [Deltaproteobacteria bacterium]|nr:hypothetical protein [Deltaproteobacteria bacterium]